MTTVIFFVVLTIYFVTGEKSVWKCCLKNEELHSNGRDCVLRIDQENTTYFSHPVRAPESKAYGYYELPEPFNSTHLKVEYSEFSTCSFNNFLILDTKESNRTRVHADMSILVYFTSVRGHGFHTKFTKRDYCIDSITGYYNSLIIRICTRHISHIKKCCPKGELVRKHEQQLKCQANISSWTLRDSVLSDLAPDNTAEDVLYDTFSLCTQDRRGIIYQGQLNGYIHDKKSANNSHIFRYSATQTLLKYEFLCVDKYIQQNKITEVVGRCYHSNENLVSFLKVHHLCLVAVILLFFAIVAIIIRVELRKSIHGQALACHAVSLVIANILRSIWWYSKWYMPAHIAECHSLASILNYFMVAAAIWLNIICINTVNEIRGSQKKRLLGIKTMVWYSVYGWIVPGIHTLLIVLQPWQERHYSEHKTHIYHTRTCIFKDEIAYSHKTEKFLYYYGPMTAILIANIALLVYSIMKCNQLQSSVTAMRGGRGTRPMSSKTVPEQALMYVRLLISAGIGEMIAELVAWALNNPVRHGPDGSRLAEKKLLQMEVGEKEILFWIMATVFDFLRALSIFVLCFSNRRTVRAMRDCIKSWTQCNREPRHARFSSAAAQAEDCPEGIPMRPLTPSF